MSENITELIRREGWQIKGHGRDARIVAYGQEFPINHPVQVYLKLYRTETIPDLKYQYMKAAHDYLWPKLIKSWSYWDERRFRTHCGDYKYITYAGGASTGKSHCAARIALLFWLADPKKRIVIVASTTLESLNSRIFGYCTNLLQNTDIPVTYQYYRGNTPKIMYDREQSTHGIFAVSAKQGDDDKAISSWIGRHSENGILVTLDEGSDMPLALLKALPNLEAGAEFFQCVAIANSKSKFDLHGSLSTPATGWGSINPKETTSWKTTQSKGICLYFNCYESPAIYETDPIKKRILSKFLITEDQIKEKEKLYGKDSESFYRFVLGFWKSSGSDDLLMSEAFIAPKKIYEEAHWLGVDPLIVVAGLDPAFSSGGDLCVLRLAYLGQDIEGNILLDFRGEKLLFRISISAVSGDSAEIQIAKQVTEILNKYGCPLHHLVIDASGQGRALGGTLQLYANSVRAPIKIYNVRTGNQKDKSFDVVPKTRHELWFDVRNYIEAGSIRGVDSVALSQLSSRLIIRNDKTGKQELESKGDYKKRMGAIMPSLAHSPDEADAMALCLQSAILNFGFYPGQTREVPKLEPGVIQEIAAWKSNVRAIQEDYMKGGIPAGQPVATFAADTIKKWGAL